MLSQQQSLGGHGKEAILFVGHTERHGRGKDVKVTCVLRKGIWFTAGGRRAALYVGELA
jgi:hypothetical protein